MTQPLVSVFMPTCNHEKFIAAALDSVISQGVDGMQIVVVDDCSHDRTPEIVEQYAMRHPEITFHRNSTNLGVTKTFNAVLALCLGKYVAIFSGDDLMNPGKLKRQLCVMEEDSNCILCYHDVEVFDSESNATLRLWNSGRGAEKPFAGEASVVGRVVVLRGTFMEAASVMLRRSAVPRWGFDERIPISSDYLMWIDVLGLNQGGTVHFIPEVLGRYRRHSGNVTARSSYAFEELSLTLVIARSRYPQYAKEARLHELAVMNAWAYYEIRRGNLQAARNILNAVLSPPSLMVRLRRLLLLLETYEITFPFTRWAETMKAWLL